MKLKIKIVKIQDKTLQKYLHEIEKRLEAADGLDSERALYRRKKINCLVIEEEGTTGLTGDTEDSEKEGEKERWNAFWIGEGSETKDGTSLGRRGEGKQTMHDISIYKSVFGLSNQEDGQKNLLMGKCVLPKTYKLDGKTYGRSAFFCDEKKVGDYLQQIPIKDKNEIDLFKKDFGIKRSNASGTSWVIRGIKDEFNVENILKAFVREYYIAILNNQLSIELENKTLDSSNLMTKIDALNIFSANDAVYVKWAIQSLATEPNKVRIKEDWFIGRDEPASEDSIKTLKHYRDIFDNNETLSLSVPVSLQKKGQSKKICNLRVYLKRSDLVGSSRARYVRDCLIVDREEKHIRPVPGKFFGLVYCKDPDLVEFLGDAEDASHREWNQKEPRLGKKYSDNQATLTQVRRSVPAFLRLLSGLQQDRYDDLFNDLISIPLLERKKKPKKNVDAPDVPNPRPPVLRKTLFICSQNQGKLKLVAGPDIDPKDLPMKVDFEFAYNVFGEQGNPFKKYHLYDFDLKDRFFKIKEKDCKVLMRDENQLQLEVSSTSYQIEIDGFDETSVAVRKI